MTYDHTNDNVGVRIVGTKSIVCCTRARYEFDSVLKAKDFIDAVFPGLILKARKP